MDAAGLTSTLFKLMRDKISKIQPRNLRLVPTHQATERSLYHQIWESKEKRNVSTYHLFIIHTTVSILRIDLNIQDGSFE